MSGLFINFSQFNKYNGREYMTTAHSGVEGGGDGIVVTTADPENGDGRHTTTAVNEDGQVLTKAYPEGGDDWATTEAIGEEGGGATTKALGEEGGDVTTMAVGEEGGGFTDALNEGGGYITTALHEGGGPGILPGGCYPPRPPKPTPPEEPPIATTLAVGEEGGDEIPFQVGDSVEDFMDSVDTNGDGQVTQKELVSFRKEAYLEGDKATVNFITALINRFPKIQGLDKTDGVRNAISEKDLAALAGKGGEKEALEVDDIKALDKKPAPPPKPGPGGGFEDLILKILEIFKELFGGRF